MSSCFNLECCNLKNTENVIKAYLCCVCVCGFGGRKGQGKEVPKEGNGSTFMKTYSKIHSEALSD